MIIIDRYSAFEGQNKPGLAKVDFWLEGAEIAITGNALDLINPYSEERNEKN